LSDSAEAEFSLFERLDGTVLNWKGNEGKPGRRFKLDDATWKGTNSKKQFVWRGAKPSPKREWMYDKAGMEARRVGPSQPTEILRQGQGIGHKMELRASFSASK
jgi:hypothetical protein